MRISVAASIVLVLALVSNVATAQQLDYNITGAGARAAGFAGAFIGVADDATAIVWNPAGLTQLERVEASVVTRYVMESSDYTSKTSSSYNESTILNHFVLNFGSIAFPFRLGSINTVLAAAYQRQLDFYGKEKNPTDEYEETGGVDTFSPGIAFQLAPVISLGVVANIWFGSDDYNASDFTSPYRKTTGTGSAKGLNFIAGTLIDLGALKSPIPLKFGAAVRTPFELTLDRSLEWNPPIGTYSRVDYKTTVQMPLMIGVGASVRPVEDLTLAVDYEMRKFGDRKLTQEFSDPFIQSVLGGEFDMSDSKKDLNQIRAGLEYLIVTSAGVFPLRAGYQSVPTLLADYDASGNPTQQVIGNGFSAGTGFISGSFALDVTYSYMTYENGDSYGTVTVNKSMITGSLIVYF